MKGIVTYSYLDACYDNLDSQTPQIILGQSVPSYVINMIPASFDSYDQDPFENPGVYFRDCRVKFRNLNSQSLCNTDNAGFLSLIINWSQLYKKRHLRR